MEGAEQDEDAAEKLDAERGDEEKWSRVRNWKLSMRDAREDWTESDGGPREEMEQEGKPVGRSGQEGVAGRLPEFG